MKSSTARQRRATIPLSNKSFDAIGLSTGRSGGYSTARGSNALDAGTSLSPTGPSTSLVIRRGSAASRYIMDAGTSLSLVPTPPTGRRGSFLYRSSDSITDLSPMSLSRKLSATSDAPQEDMIVTPFAQILQSLRSVRDNYIIITNAAHSSEQNGCCDAISNDLYPTAEDAISEQDSQQLCTRQQRKIQQSPVTLQNDQCPRLAIDTLEELEWCLDQLEKMQTHRSVADMATNKFKRMLNRELNQFSETSKSGTEISEYICSTFLDTQEDLQLPVFCFEDTDDNKIRSSRRQSQPATAAVVDVNLSAAAQLALLEPGPAARPDARLAECMKMLDVWGPDIFHLADITNNRPLTTMVYAIFKDMDAMRLLQISPATLVLYLTLLEGHYSPNNPYHNSVHAADVTQSANVLLRRPVLQDVYTELELVAAVFASAVHDVDHPGVSSQYLINSNLELALMYNDQSVLENHHLAVAFKLLQTEGADIFQNLSLKSYQTLRRIVIDMVLATDMTKHLGLVADLKTMVETKRVSGSGVLCLDNYSDRVQLLKTLVHCADLSNPTKPLPIYRQWTERIMDEFFRQGDLEREQGLDVSPMCDRQLASVEQSQVGFMDFIVHPLWETWSELVYPDCQDVLDNLESNRTWFKNRAAQQYQTQGLSKDVVVEEENEDNEEVHQHINNTSNHQQ